MEQLYIEEKIFNKKDFKDLPLAIGNYEYCTFKHSDFSNTDLSDFKFSDCQFIGCNLSLVKLRNTAFRNCQFLDSKLMGLHFEDCNKFGFTLRFENCILNHSSFFETKLKKTIFKNAKLQEVDFSECDLSGAIFDHCDLLKASFVRTNIEKADFTTSINYSIDLDLNRIKKAKFSQSGIIGLLNKYDIEINPTT